MKKLLSVILVFCIVSAILPMSASAISQDANEVYQIGSAQDLVDFANIVNTTNINAKAKLTSDIDMAGITWLGIASYSGTFDGAGFSIKNLNASNNGEGTKGFVEVLQMGGIIKNLKFDTVNVFLQTSNRSAVIAGENNGTISGCFVESAVVQCGNYNGLAGVVAINNSEGTVENCLVLNSNFIRRYGRTERTIGAVVDENHGTVKSCMSYGCFINNSESAPRGGIVTSGNAPTNSYFYTSATTNSTVDGISKTAAQFASGEVCFNLNGGKTDGTQVWYQTIGADYPTFDGETVYQVTKYESCDKTVTPTIEYSNTDDGEYAPPHNYENGICSHCQALEAATLGSDGYYEIENCGNFKWFAEKVNSGDEAINGRLTSDITLEGTWTPIGDNRVDYKKKYTGKFDGQHHSVSGLFIDSTYSYQGLFGYANGAEIKNIEVSGCNVKGRLFVAAICGYGESSTIEGCGASGTIAGCTYASSSLSGICGRMKDGTIRNCHSSVNFTINSNDTSSDTPCNIGGICGYLYESSIEGCYSDITFDTTLDKANRIGILCGNTSWLIISNCCYMSQGNLPDVGENVTSYRATAISDFSTGEACYILNGGITDGTQSWYQTVGVGKPSYSGETVYKYVENNGNVYYVNTDPGEQHHIHFYDENGYCSDCGNWRPPVLSSDNYYQITTAHELKWFADLVNGNLSDYRQNTAANAVLMNNIDMSEICSEALNKSWDPIGSIEKKYSGTFDGNGYTINNLYIYSSANDIGLFGVTQRANIKNINLATCNIAGNDYVGGVVGDALATNISHIKVQGTVWGSNKTGGIVGNLQASTLQSSYSTATVSGSTEVGMVCGKNDSSNIENCCYLISGGNIGDETATGITDFSTGEACAILNNKVSDGTQKWYQTIGTDSYPVLDNTHSTVYSGYQTTSCLDTTIVYSNDSSLNLTHEKIHHYDQNGFCDICEASYEPAVKIDNNVYEIGNAGQLKWFAIMCNTNNNFSNNNVALTSDIDLSSVCSETLGSWTPINCSMISFNGNGHKITNLYINSTSDYQGLFGEDDKCMIYDLGIENCDITGGNYVGGITGESTYSTLKNCYVSGSVNGSDYVGGICGGKTKGGGEITSCYSTATVSGTGKIGGISGCITNAEIIMRNCCYMSQGNLPDVGENVTSYRATAISDFSTGEACVILNNKVSDGTQKWYQTVGEGVPSFDSTKGTVYLSSNGKFSNTNALAIHSFEDDKVTINVPQTMNATLIFVSYDGDGKMIDIKYKDNINIANGVAEYTAPDGFITENAKTIKMFMWENMTSLNPLCENLVKEITE